MPGHRLVHKAHVVHWSFDAEGCSNWAEIATTSPHGAMKGKTQNNITRVYNLDVIISVGYRVKSLRGTQFRIWATGIRFEN